MRLRSYWVMCALVLSTSGTRAQEQQEPSVDPQVAEAQTQDRRDKAARGLFEAGGVAFEEGRYEEALEHFGKAYELSPNRHLLLYNIASSLDRLRRDEEALQAFEKYLQLNPTAPNRPAVEARVRVLRQAVDAQARQEAAKPVEPGPLAEPPRVVLTPAPAPAVDGGRQERKGWSPLVAYLGMGVTAALGGLTVWSGLNTNTARDGYESYSQTPGATATESERLYNDGIKRQTRTNILAGVTGVAAVGTAVTAIFLTDWRWRVLRSRRRLQDAKTQPQVSAGAGHFKVGFSHAF